MPEEVLGLRYEIAADPSQAEAGLNRFAVAAEEATAKIGMHGAAYDKAHGAALVFERELGVHLPRAF